VARALALASTVHVLHKGEIVFSGPSDGLEEETLFALYSGEPVG
jgi:ABC-type branched-subunit amino acid transport system ATPase component